MRNALFAMLSFGALFLVVSCSSSGGGQTALQNAPAFRENINTWALPLDSYVPDYARQQYAQNLLYADCMKQHGFTVEAYNIADYLPPNRNGVLRKLFNLGLAEKYGYHNGTPRAGYLDKSVLPPEQTEQANACTANAQKQIKENSDATNYVESLTLQAEDVALSDAGVRAAASRWHTCMLPQGIPDLPSNPEDMPTESQRSRFNMTGPANPAPGQLPAPSQPTPAEIRQAVFDARCRISSGYSQTFYQAELNAQRRLIAENENKVASALAATQRAAAAVAEILRSHGR